VTASRAVSRRRFLASAGAVAGVAVAARVEPWRIVVEVAERSAAERIVGLFAAHPDSAREIGGRYLRSEPEEASVRRLVAEISKGLPLGRRTLTGSDDHLRADLLRSIQREFADGAWVDVDGWILSQTEARAYALTTLVPSSRPA
jgi:hypothetical protein